MNRITANEYTLKEYLSIGGSIGSLTIPFSQRPYEWGKAQVERLFNDLISLYEEDNDIHMLNFFTLSHENDERKIFDGQQRTITTILIIAAFIKQLDESNPKAANGLYEDFVEKEDYLSKDKSSNKEYKLYFDNKKVEEFFYNLISIDSLESSIKEDVFSDYDIEQSTEKSIKNIKSNYDYINSLLNLFSEKADMDEDGLLDLISKVLENTNLIVIQTDTDELAMAMFETLNNTGKKLENFYVLKNDLVLLLGEENVRHRWSVIEGNLSDYDPSSFIQTFAKINAGPSTKNNSLNKIYESYKKNSPSEMDELLQDLEDASKKYLLIRNPVQASIRDHGDLNYTEYKVLSNQVKQFITSQHHSLLLALFMDGRNFSEVNKVLKVLLNLGIRNFYFKERRANTIEGFIANLAKQVFIEKRSTEEVLKDIQNETINTDELHDAIVSKRIKNSNTQNKLKFILREVFNQQDLNKETEIKKSYTEIHYEHILPRSPKKESQWLVDFPNLEEREDYVQKIGNGTLLLDKINQGISNSDFSHKSRIYEESDIPENKEISKNVRWTKNEIDKRGELLANKIIKYLESLV